MLGHAKLKKVSKLMGRGPEIPIVTLSASGSVADDAGPHVVVTANIHGDEVTGIGVAKRLIDELQIIRGKVTIIPSVSPLALRAGTRKIPGDGNDLNRVFPGKKRGGPAEKTAWRLWETLVALSPDLLLDLHTDSSVAIPYVIVDRQIDGALDIQNDCFAIAIESGLDVVLEYPLDRYTRFKLDNSLSGAVMNHLNIPALTFEVGPRRLVSH